MFNLDLGNIKISFIPRHWRRVNFIDFLTAIYKPFYTFQTTFNQYFNDVEYAMLWNGQVIMLEHYLNDLYDPINRGIYITDGQQLDVLYVSTIEENEPIYISTILENNTEFIVNPIESYNTDSDFEINIPIGTYFNESVLRSQVNKYKLAGKQYIINQI